MPYSTNLRLAVFKQESSPGTAEFDLSSTHPADADCDIRVFNPEFSFEIAKDDENAKVATGDHGEVESIPGQRTGTFTFGLKIPWGGDVTTFPNASKAMQMCGAIETSYTTVGRAWQPKAAGDDVTYTGVFYHIEVGATPSAVAHLVKGISGNAIVGSDGVGAPVMGQFTAVGSYVGQYDVANSDIPVLTGADVLLPETFLNVPVSIGGVTQCMTSWQLDFGNNNQPVVCQSDASGINYHYIAERRPRLSVNPMMQSVATEDLFSIETNATSRTITMQYATNHLKLTCPRTQLLGNGITSREGLDAWEQNYKLLRNNVGAGKADSDLDDEVTWELLFGARS